MTTAAAGWRTFLEAFDRGLAREAHNLARWPALTWQQLSNHLRWEPDPVGAIVADRERSASGPWFRLRKRLPDASLRTLVGHTDGITACTVAPDSSYIVSASKDGTLKMWDVPTGLEIRTFIGHMTGVTDCAVALDGSYIVSAGSDETLRLWDPSTGNERASLHHPGGISACALAPDGSYLVSAGPELKMWDLSSHEEIGSLAVDASRIAVSPDGSFIMTTGGATTRLWDPSTGAELHILEDWRLEPGEIIESGTSTHGRDCAMSPDGTFVASGHGDLNITLWDPDSGEKLRTLEARPLKVAHGELVAQPSLECWAVAPDGSYIVAGGEDTTVRIWDAASGDELHILGGHGSGVRTCAIAPSGAFLVSAAGAELKIWNPHQEEDPPEFSPHTERVSGCAISPDGRYAVTAGWEELKFWDISTSERTSTWETWPHRSLDCAISPDGVYMISAGRGSFQLWDPETAQALDETAFKRDPVTRQPVDPAIRRQLVEQIRELRSRGLNTLLGEHSVGLRIESCAVSPDGSFVILVDSSSITMWDAAALRQWNPASGRFHEPSERGGPLRSIEVPGTLTASAVAPDGSFLASASLDGRLRFWSPRSGRLLRAFEGHTEWVSCAVSPDAAWLVSAKLDDALRLWDPTSGEELRRLEGQIGVVRRIAIAPDGTLIAAAGDGRSLRIWDASTGHERGKVPLLSNVSSVAFHPYMPLVVCGDTAGNVYFFDVVGVEYGPIVATAIERDGRRTVRCPKCWRLHALDEAWLGRVIDCPTPTCDLRLRVNPFVVTRPHWLPARTDPDPAGDDFQSRPGTGGLPKRLFRRNP